MELDERTLPLYLQKDIKEFVNYKNSDINPKLRLDIYWGELYGSINSAQHSYEIT